ncbi:hypothetical protein [Microbacterium sp.]|uniref:hypothetical protein n=1 Tax=Microbacterium sp. TaxID=51671 RepID=UPI00262FE2C9|nr:hypothetical protein [Microbacterium sp.]
MARLLVDHEKDAELIEQVSREMRRVEFESPRWRASYDMAAVAISLTRQHDARKETQHEHDHTDAAD